MSLAQEIKKLRTAAKLTQKQLADTIGVSQGFIARLETGMDADLRASTLMRLADALGKDCQHFRPFLGAAEPPPAPRGRPKKKNT